MEKKEQQQVVIPDYIIRKKEKESFERGFVSALNACESAYETLKAMPDLENIPNTLQEIKSDFVATFVEERINEIADTKILTHEAKKKAKQDWKNVLNEAKTQISIIQNFLQSYPDADVCIKEGKVVCSNMESVVYEHCKIKTPDIVSKHVKLIQAVKDSIYRLQEFEKANGFPTGDIYNVEMDLRLLDEPINLIENWLWQDTRRAEISKHHYMQASLAEMERRQKAENKVKMNERAQKYEREHPEDYIPHLVNRHDELANGTVTMQ